MVLQAKVQHADSAENTNHDNDKGSEETKKDDLERLQITKEGEMQTHDAEAAKREWIKRSPESPRNWPLLLKWWLIAGLNFYTIVTFICNTGFVTDDAENNFGTNKESAVCGQSMVRVLLIALA